VLRRQPWDNLTESVLPIRTNKVLNKPIVAGQRALSPYPRRSPTGESTDRGLAANDQSHIANGGFWRSSQLGLMRGIPRWCEA
jgi:hypothetical protein